MPSGRPKKNASPTPSAPAASDFVDAGVPFTGRDAVVPSPAVWAQIEKLAAMVISSGVKPQKLTTADQVFIILLKAWELNLPLLASIRQLYIADDGQIGLMAEAQRALIEKSGLGYIGLLEQDDQHAKVEAVRFGRNGRPDRVTNFTYTVQEILRGQEGGVKYPADSCFARATSRAARAMFSDVVAGVAYDPEELQTRKTYPDASRNGPVSRQEPPGATPAHSKPPQATPPPEKPAEPIPARSAPPADPVPTPEPPVAPPAGAVAGAPPAEDGLPAKTHPIQVARPGGGVQVEFTAGIDLPQLRAIAALSTDAPHGPALYQAGKEWLAGLGVPNLRYCTKEQGDTLHAMLIRLKDQLDAPPPTREENLAGAGPMEFYRAVILKHKLGDQLVDDFVKSNLGVDSIEGIDHAQLVKIAQEIDTFATQDPDAVLVVLGRAAGGGAQPGA